MPLVRASIWLPEDKNEKPCAWGDFWGSHRQQLHLQYWEAASSEAEEAQSRQELTWWPCMLVLAGKSMFSSAADLSQKEPPVHSIQPLSR